MTNFGLQCNVTKYVTAANLQEQWRIKSGSFHIRRISIKTQPTKNSDHAYVVYVFKDDKRNICEKTFGSVGRINYPLRLIKDQCFVVYITKRLNK